MISMYLMRNHVNFDSNWNPEKNAENFVEFKKGILNEKSLLFELIFFLRKKKFAIF